MSISVPDHDCAVEAPVRRLRVLHVVPSLYGGGLERGLLRLVCGQPAVDPESGVQVVHGVCLLQGGDQGLIEECRDAVPTWVLGSTGMVGKRIAGLRLHSVASRFRADVVHVRSTSAWLDARIAVQGLGRTRLVLGFHGRTRLGPTGRIRRMINRWCAARASAVVSVSAHAARMLQDEWGIPGQRLCVLRNGVDTCRFRPPSDQTERDECRRILGVDRAAQAVVCIANLVPIKNLDGLLRAWREVGMVSSAARLVVVGDGPLRAELERQAAELRCADTVRFLGSRRDVPALLRGADLSVLASHYEGTSNAVLESMASGLAVVASDVGGTPELITPNRTGWLVSGSDPHRLAEVLSAALRERAARQRVGLAAREAVLKHFSMEAWVSAHEHLYQSIVLRPCGRASMQGPEDASCAE